MNACLLCKQLVNERLTWQQFIWGTKIYPATLCVKCYRSFATLALNGCCWSCARELKDTKKQCLECQKWGAIHPEIVCPHQAVFMYNRAMKDYFQLYKFQGDMRLATTFRQLIFECLAPYRAEYVLVPIPLTNKRFAERGFNQVSEWLRAAELPFVELLGKRGELETSAQATKTRSERLASENLFFVQKNKLKDVKPNFKRCLIIDDIYTTGTTLMQAKSCLQEVFGNKMRTFTLARS